MSAEENREYVRRELRRNLGEQEARNIEHAANVRFIRDLMRSAEVDHEFYGIINATDWNDVQ